jgi:formamidopyrimidine-DNA glycosylase
VAIDPGAARLGLIATMPELPEVETVRLGLTPALLGHRFLRVEQRRKDLRFPLPERFAERLTGRRIERIERRAKYLLMYLDDGLVLTVHLGMTGRFRVNARQIGEHAHRHGGLGKHDHLVFAMSGGAIVTYNDARRFGYMTLVPAGDLAEHAFFRGLGVEPLSADLSPQYLARRAMGRKAGLKALLTDQTIVAGLGNIYACEALFRAGLDPFKPARRLAGSRGAATALARRLVTAIKAVLGQAIRAGGSTLRDYQQADGSAGSFQNEFQIYGREGEPCHRRACRGTVRRRRQGGRSTFYCPLCQRE